MSDWCWQQFCGLADDLEVGAMSCSFWSCWMTHIHHSLQGSTKACLGAHRILNDYQQAGNMLGLVHMCFALMVVLIEDGFCMFACCRNCVIPKTACLVVGWLWTKLKWGSVKSPNVSIIVAVWISIPWGIWRVSSLHAAPLCVRREFLLVVKDCVWRFSSQDSGYI